MDSKADFLIHNLPEAIIMLDTEGYIVFANAFVTHLIGYQPSELYNKHLHVLYNNEDDAVKADYELMQARKKGSFICEGWKKKKNEERFWAETMLTAIYQGKKLTGFSCIIREAFFKKQQELALKESEERYRLMVENVRDYAIFMMDPTGHILTWNEGARKTKGYLKDEIIGKHFSIFYTAEDLETEKPRRELEIAIATGKYEEEGWRIKKNGSLFWANVVITALFNDRNQHVGFSKVTRDLTERKENEEYLRQSEERYRSLVEQVADYGIFLMDEKGRIASWNEGARRINGYTAEEAIGKHFSMFYPEEDILNGKPDRELRIAKEEGKYEEEGWRLKKDGTRFWTSIVITPVYNSERILIGFSKVTRDLTERKESERALRMSHDQYRLLTEELKVTNEELSYANKELEQFTSIVSHDLQEPIRSIKSFLQLLEMRLSEKRFDEISIYLEKSLNTAERMRMLILSLLNYSQLSKVEIVRQQVDLNDVLQQTLQNLKSAIDLSRASIIIDSEVETVFGDPTQLIQLFQNLMSNSLKFTRKSNPQVRVTVKRMGEYVKFGIADNGIGIAREDVEKVFEIFRRLNTPKDFPGTGIGLAICKKIVERHEGAIWAESELGKGTTFYFTLQDEKNSFGSPKHMEASAPDRYKNESEI